MFWELLTKEKKTKKGKKIKAKSKKLNNKTSSDLMRGERGAMED